MITNPASEHIRERERGEEATREEMAVSLLQGRIRIVSIE